MTLPASKFLFPILALLVIAGGAYEWSRRQPANQIPALFARLETAFQDKDASAVMACVHRDYDLAGTWPQLLQNREHARGDAQRFLAQAFLLSRDEPITASVTMTSWNLLPDGSASAVINLGIQGGPFSSAVPLLSNHRFLVKKSSWMTGTWAITGHDPIAANLPSL